MSRVPFRALRHPAVWLAPLFAIALTACGGGTDTDAPAPQTTDAEDAADRAADAPAADTDAGDEVDDPALMGARMGAGMQALMERCEGIEGEAITFNAQQRREFEEQGIDPDAFQVTYRDAYAEARRDVAAMSADDLARGCEEMEALRQMAEQMEAQAG